MFKTILIAALVSWLVSYLTAKRCLDHIDRYVLSVLGDLKKVAKKLEEKVSRDRPV